MSSFSPLKICVACSVTALPSSLQLLRLQPCDCLQVGERSSGMHRRDNCQASLQTPTPNQLLAPHGQERVGSGGGRVQMWHHSVSWALRHGTFLLPDHIQMCQVCPNRNDCVKAIFSNLSDFNVPTTTPPPLDAP